MGSLPKTRPQRASARRGEARSRAAAKATEGGPATTTTTRTKPSRAKAEAKPRRAKPARAAEPPRAPRQGFESESDVEPGKTVQPPGSAELAASVVELIGELAQSGLSSGGKLLKDALARLGRS